MNRSWKLALCGLAGYPALELICRRRTHWSMALAGAVTLPLLGRLSRRKRLPYRGRCLLGALLITGIELIFGCVFNLLLHKNVWSYARRRCNLRGQICLSASLRWYGLCLLLLPLLGRSRP
ncbi:MAG: hypothetical protein IJI40_01790 [Firmicutes bacterium]|nr:hypothetical protein [Bacillota bacterium]